jgi:hypothetical protein
MSQRRRPLSLYTFALHISLGAEEVTGLYVEAASTRLFRWRGSYLGAFQCLSHLAALVTFSLIGNVATDRLELALCE